MTEEANLNERAMLAKLKISIWGASHHDAEISEEVNSSHNASSDAGRYSKLLVARRFLSPVTTKASVAIKTHKLLTLPWDDKGPRILSAMNYDKYTEEMKRHRLGLSQAADEFVKKLPDAVAEAKTRLGTMFDADEYPDPILLREKFKLETEIMPLPDSKDFRVKLSDASTKAIMKDIERRSSERLQNAVADIYERIASSTENMAKKLREYEPGQIGIATKGTFRDSLVYNIKEMADMLPALNITNDPKLTALQKRITEELGAVDPAELRKDAKLRKKTADAAEKILSKVKGFMA